jgi:hypothetical protein
MFSMRAVTLEPELASNIDKEAGWTRSRCWS